MVYVTIKDRAQQSYTPQVNPTTFEDLLRYGIDYVAPIANPVPSFQNYDRTHTFVAEKTDDNYLRLCEKYPIEDMRRRIHNLAINHQNLLQEDMSAQYNTFFVPKHSGGMRRIDAPLPELMGALTEVKNVFEHNLYTLSHNAAHAYTAHRSSITAMKLHQANESKWFLKLDLKDFFPSHNLEYILNTLEQLFPYSELSGEDLTTLIKLGLLNDSLPQGTPLSPMLTNVLMTPIDQAIMNMLRREQNLSFVYTRYADDLLISCRYHFNWRTIQEKINYILQENHTPFQLKAEKTRYGSASGRNWNLGIMLNKDNKMTIGHKQNQRFRAAVHNFLRDLTTNNPWDKMDVQVLLGQISYYKAIEPEYVNHVIQTYSEKFNIDFMRVAKAALR